jgi:hypothetical protein
VSRLAGRRAASVALVLGVLALTGPSCLLLEPPSGVRQDADADGSAGESGAATPDSSTTDVGVDAAPCVQDLSGIENGGFYISFTLQTTQPDSVIALVNQRDQCTNGVFWDLRLVNAQLFLEISDLDRGITIVRSRTSMPLNDGMAHGIRATRVDNEVQLTVDGAPSGSAMAIQSFGATELAPLKAGDDVCGADTGSAAFDIMMGSIRDLCVRPQ